jgi:hypothetical protein
MSLLRHWAIDLLLIAVGALLVVAVAVDVGRRVTFDRRIRTDRHALLAYLRTHDSHHGLVRIHVHAGRDLVCAPARDRDREQRPVDLCVEVASGGAQAGRVLAGYALKLGARDLPRARFACFGPVRCGAAPRTTSGGSLERLPPMFR